MKARTHNKKLFRMFFNKETNYVMKIMDIWMALGKLEVSKSKRDFICISVSKETKHCTYQQTYRIFFKYRHQFYDNNNHILVQISLYSTWATGFCPYCKFPGILTCQMLIQLLRQVTLKIMG